MKVCIVAEGCYPYVVGGVSSWINSMIKSFSRHRIRGACDCSKPFIQRKICL